MADHSPVPICARCGKRVGVYERAWLERHDGAIEASSLLNMGREGLNAFAFRLWHHECLPADEVPPSG